MLGARDTHAGATLADLYGLDVMPPNLWRAHLPLERTADLLHAVSALPSNANASNIC